MVTLTRRTTITRHRLGRGITVQAGVFVIGVAHPWCRPFCEHRLQGGARLRIQPTTDIAHTVGLLAIDGQIAPPRPIGIREFAVLVQEDRQSVSGLAQFLGFEATREFGQVSLGGLPGVEVDESRAAGRRTAE